MDQREIIEEMAKHNTQMDWCRQQNTDWLRRFAPHFTHALTLTFNEKKIWRFENKVSNTRLLKKDEMLCLRKQSFRYFGKRLACSLFGNSSMRHGEKLLLIGCIEGLRLGERPHYHCMLGVPESRFEVLEKKVRDAWTSAPFAGKELALERYYGSNWTDYSAKSSRYIDRECIDWDNIRIPTSLQTHC